MDFNTGQITVKHGMMTKQGGKLHSIGSQVSSSIVDSKNKTIETPHNADRLFGQRYTHLHNTMQLNQPLLDSQRQINSQRWIVTGNELVQNKQLPSTLMKNSVTQSGGHNTLQQQLLADSPTNLA